MDSSSAGHKLPASLHSSPNIDPKVCDTQERSRNDIGNEESFPEESKLKRTYYVCPKLTHTPTNRTLVSDYKSFTLIEFESDDSIFSNTTPVRKK